MPLQGEYITRAAARSSETPAAPAAPVTAPVTPRRFLATLTSEDRKRYPVTTGFLDYFPDAVALVANVSWHGNNKHNPGKPLHWSRGKSADHEDCCGRHLIERHGMDGEIWHAAALAWRAMANLQMLAEEKYKLDPPHGAK